MPSVYQPRRPRASPLWQLVQHGWADFLADYEKHHRKSLGPLRPAAVATVQSFLRCGDLASGFTRLQFSSVFDSIWWALATLTTVGYGDVYPVTVGGKIFTFFVLAIGLGVAAIPSGLIASALTKAREEE